MEAALACRREFYGMEKALSMRSFMMETRLSSRGNPYVLWKRVMPRIPDIMLDCVVYLYESVDHAIASANKGGSGFLLGVPLSEVPNRGVVYVVTNKHVA